MAIGEGASFRAEEILREVVQLFENGNLEMQPDAAIYNVRNREDLAMCSTCTKRLLILK